MTGRILESRVRAVWAVLFVASLGYGSARPAAQAGPGAQTPAPANTVVATAVKTAAADGKVVLIEFGASWCIWCRRFDSFVHAPEIASVVAANYVVVNLVVQERDDKKILEHPGGQDVMDGWGGAKSGLPFYVFLDASGKKIVDSNAMADGKNVGFPGNAKEVDVFLGLIDKTAPRLSKSDRAKIVSYLKANIKP